MGPLHCSNFIPDIVHSWPAVQIKRLFLSQSRRVDFTLRVVNAVEYGASNNESGSLGYETPVQVGLETLGTDARWDY